MLLPLLLLLPLEISFWLLLPLASQISYPIWISVTAYIADLFYSNWYSQQISLTTTAFHWKFHLVATFLIDFISYGTYIADFIEVVTFLVDFYFGCYIHQGWFSFTVDLTSVATSIACIISAASFIADFISAGAYI